MCVCSVLLTCVSLRFFTWEVCVCVCVCVRGREREREREREKERERWVLYKGNGEDVSFVQTAAHEEVSYFGFRERERERDSFHRL